MSLSSALLACAIGLAGQFDDSPACALRYTGTLVRGVRSGEGTPVKRFTLYVLAAKQGDQRQITWFLTERGGGAWSWPERLGTLNLGSDLKPAAGKGVSLLYDYDGSPTVLAVPFPIVEFAGKLTPQATWTVGKETWEVLKPTRLADRDCWQVAVTTGFGRKRTVWVQTDAPVMVALEEKIFVGQGDEHKLTVQLEAFESVSQAELDRLETVRGKLIQLQEGLRRNPGEFRPELSQEQLDLVSRSLPELKKLAEDTPLSALVTAISSDLRGQSDRTSEVSRLQEKFVGKPAPEFELELLDKTRVASVDLKDQVIVLHFWEYQSEPLVEPYGQVGYLDFLNDRRRKLGVKVLGVAVDERFAQEQSGLSAAKSVHKLKSFMNLGYGIGTDDGKLLKKFGDPRESNAKLPLWVVIGPDGRIAHYHAGLYTINADEGLKELDEQLIKLIRKQRGKGDE